MKSFCSLLFAGAAALLLAACSTAVSPEKAAQVDSAKTGLVLATVAESGMSNAWAEFTLRAVGGAENSGHHRAIDTSKELWLLEIPPGRYRIADWNVPGATLATVGKFEFEVRPGEVTYLGNFLISGQLKTDPSGRQGVFIWSRPVLEDRSKAAVESFRKQYPALAAVPVRSVAPERTDLIPTVAGQLAWETSAGQYYPGNSKQNESGQEAVPSGPRWP